MPHHSLPPHVISALLTAALLPAPATGQVPILEESALLTGSQPDSTFGWGIATDGNRFVAGAHHADDNRGAVYVFELGPGGWLETARLVTSDGDVGDHFGASVTISPSPTAAMTPSGKTLVRCIGTSGRGTNGTSAGCWDRAQRT